MFAPATVLIRKIENDMSGAGRGSRGDEADQQHEAAVKTPIVLAEVQP